VISNAHCSARPAESRDLVRNDRFQYVSKVQMPNVLARLGYACQISGSNGLRGVDQHTDKQQWGNNSGNTDSSLKAHGHSFGIQIVSLGAGNTRSRRVAPLLPMSQFTRDFGR